MASQHKPRPPVVPPPVREQPKIHEWTTVDSPEAFAKNWEEFKKQMKWDRSLRPEHREHLAFYAGAMTMAIMLDAIANLPDKAEAEMMELFKRPVKEVIDWMKKQPEFKGWFHPDV